MGELMTPESCFTPVSPLTDTTPMGFSFSVLPLMKYESRGSSEGSGTLRASVAFPPGVLVAQEVSDTPRLVCVLPSAL